ncbi:MAG: hypothetical protein AAF196_20730 [Planctomycetota bacterium]
MGGSSVFMGALVKMFLAWLSRRKRDRIVSGLDSINDIYQEKNRIRALTRACRVLLLVTENNGGIPQAGTPVFSSVLYESVDESKGLEPIRDHWQKRPLDDEYAELIHRVLKDGRVSLKQEDTRETSVLGVAYRAAGIQRSEVFAIAVTPKKFFYLTVNFQLKDMKSESLTAQELDVINGAVAKIRVLLEKRGHDVLPGQPMRIAK